MNENFSEEQNASLMEQGVEKAPLEEKPIDTLPETLQQVDIIQGGDKESAFLVDSVAEGVAERISATHEQVEAAKTEVNFTERSSSLEIKKQGIREKFDAEVRKALLPVMSAFLISSSGFAQEVSTAPLVPEAVKIVKQENSEIKKLSFEDVFDVRSPLAQSSEKQTTREMVPEELAVLKDLHEKTWNEDSEWAAFTGKGKDGKHKVKMMEMGATGGYAEVLVEDELDPEIMTHTHPIMQAGVIGLSGEDIRQGKEKSFIMPPSSADLGACMDTSSSLQQRVVDSRGVWEYSCDENHPFVQEKKKMESELETSITALKQKYKISEEDMGEAVDAARKTHPSELLYVALEHLDAKYPGIGKGGKDFFIKGVSKNAMNFAIALMTYESKVGALSLDSTRISDEELGKEIKKFIDFAVTRGMRLKYTPFKDMPEVRKEK